jgi:hypothetical protein
MLIGSDGRAHQAFDHRDHAAQFLLDRDIGRAGARGFAADVEDVGALLRQLHAVRDRGLPSSHARRRRKTNPA